MKNQKPPEDYLLDGAFDCDDINKRAYLLTGWFLRQGLTEVEAENMVMDMPRPEELQYSSKPNKTLYFVRKGVEHAIAKYEPGLYRRVYDPEPVNRLREVIAGSKIRQKRYLLGVLDLCDEYKTYTPVVTGPNLARVVGVAKGTAGPVVKEWADTFADGFFLDVTHSGRPKDGRVWTVNLDWEPSGVPTTHAEDCPRGERCNCGRVSHSALSTLSVQKIDKVKRDRFENWLRALPPGKAVTVALCRKATGLTAYMARKWLEEARGTELLADGVADRFRVYSPSGGVHHAKAWFTPGKAAPGLNHIPRVKRTQDHVRDADRLGIGQEDEDSPEDLSFLGL